MSCIISRHSKSMACITWSNPLDKAMARINHDEVCSRTPNFRTVSFQLNLVLSNRCVSENQDSEGRFDSTKFSEVSFQKIRCYRAAAFQKIRTAKGGFTKFSERCRAIEPLRFRKSGQRRAVRYHQIFRKVSFQNIWCYRTAAFQKIRTAKGGSISPNFPKGVVSESLVLSNRCSFIGLKGV